MKPEDAIEQAVAEVLADPGFQERVERIRGDVMSQFLETGHASVDLGDGLTLEVGTDASRDR